MSTAKFTSDNFPGATADFPVGKTIANIGLGKWTWEDSMVQCLTLKGL